MPLFVITVIISACSMIYELLLAQSMTILYGHATSRYSLTIGLFLFSLGMGTLAYAPLRRRYDKTKLFINLEILLCLAGVFTPIIIFSAAASPIAENIAPDIGFYFCHFWILVIGFLTGIEVPCLLDKGEGLDQIGNNTFLILSFDFLGTFLGVILFVFFLYPVIGIVGAAAVTGGLNGIAALILWNDSQTKSRSQLFFVTMSVGLSIVLFMYRGEASAFLIERAF
jgi:spermidine synthase